MIGCGVGLGGFIRVDAIFVTFTVDMKHIQCGVHPKMKWPSQFSLATKKSRHLHKSSGRAGVMAYTQ